MCASASESRSTDRAHSLHAIEPGPRTERVLQLCRDHGFALAGVTSARRSDRADAFNRWIEEDRHGQMDWLAQHADQRVDPSVKLPGARSVICVADRCADQGVPSESPPPLAGRVARYAHGDDYHHVMKKRLHAMADALRGEYADEKFVVCVDTAPVLERSAAVNAGLGFAAKNTMLIAPGLGSHLLLGEIITTLELDTHNTPRVEDRCGTCTRCIDACPTQALTPYALDARRCISYHTIEQRSAIDEQFHQAIGDWIFGCDICQEVCPHNNPIHLRSDPAPPRAYAQRLATLDLLDVLGWTHADRRRILVRSAVRRAKLWMLKRNALIVAGNVLRRSPNRTLRARIEHISTDPEEHPVVRQTARSVLDRLQIPAGS